MSTLSLVDLIPLLPKVLLHDHLDGGLRPQTVLDLAADAGHTLPASTADDLADWFESAANSGSLVRYLETFEHTVAVMQTADALRRVAREAVLDLAADSVVYAEQRWAPELHLEQGLTMQEVVDAVQAGLAEGMEEARAAGLPIRVQQVLIAIRNADRWEEVAALAVANRDRGVCGFDLAGAEDGYLPERFPQVWDRLAAANFPRTVHAGEAAGVESISQAVHLARADRLGHGVRIVEDIDFVASPGQGWEEAASATLGPLANWVRDHQIVLEASPCSNLMTGAVADARTMDRHPITRLKELDFAVTVNTDNRLMSRTSMSHEFQRLVVEADWTIDDIADVTIAAAWGAFIHHDERRALVEEVIVPGFQRLTGVQL